MHNYNKILNQTKSMVQFILDGHDLTEAADEFCISKSTAKYRLKLVGLTYTDLEKLLKERSKQAR